MLRLGVRSPLGPPDHDRRPRCFAHRGRVSSRAMGASPGRGAACRCGPRSAWLGLRCSARRSRCELDVTTESTEACIRRFLCALCVLCGQAARPGGHTPPALTLALQSTLTCAQGRTPPAGGANAARMRSAVGRRMRVCLRNVPFAAHRVNAARSAHGDRCGDTGERPSRPGKSSPNPSFGKGGTRPGEGGRVMARRPARTSSCVRPSPHAFPSPRVGRHRPEP